MGTITGQQIVDKSRKILQDTTAGGTRWLDAELLGWINDAQREVVLLKPNAYSIVENLALVQGTLQTLPASGLSLLSIVRNASGQAIRRVDRNILDSENPGWHVDPEVAVVEHYVFDEDAPDSFWVYPPQPAVSPATIEIIYSKAPADLGTLATAMTLNDIYQNIILDYVLYRAYSKDTDYAGNQSRAGSHYQAFNNALGIRTTIDTTSSPNSNVSTDRAVA